MTFYDLSVIIPAHNEEAWLDRCLASLLAQDDTVGRIEIIVVANACDDGTVAKAQSHIPAQNNAVGRCRSLI